MGIPILTHRVWEATYSKQLFFFKVSFSPCQHQISGRVSQSWQWQCYNQISQTILFSVCFSVLSRSVFLLMLTERLPATLWRAILTRDFRFLADQRLYVLIRIFLCRYKYRVYRERVEVILFLFFCFLWCVVRRDRVWGRSKKYYH